MKRNRILALCIVLLLAVQLLTPLASGVSSCTARSSTMQRANIRLRFMLRIPPSFRSGVCRMAKL